MSEEELLKILEEEEHDASAFHSSEMAHAQAEAMDRFYAKPYGDEVPGRSRTVTHDIEDTINWIMPHLMRTFMGSDELVTVEGASPEDDEPDEGGERTRSELAAAYLDHILFEDNPGETLIYDMAFDGLLQRTGIVEVEWDDPEPKPAKIIEGLTAEQLVKYAADPEYEITAQDQDESGAFAIEVVHSPSMGRVCIEGVPPEEFAISRRAKSIETADYHRRKRDVFAAELIRRYPEKARDLDPNYVMARASDDEDPHGDPRRQARFGDEADNIGRGASDHEKRRKVSLLEEYIRVDYDCDGVVELRCIKRVGDCVLENIAVERSKYVGWTPLRVAHKFAGRSLADVLLDMQRIRTVITRRALDCLAQSLTPRKVINTQMVDDQGIDDIMDNDVGGTIRVRGDVNAALREIVTPDVTGSAFQMLEYWDQRSEEASGVTRHSQGLAPQAITQTMGGIDLLQMAAMARVEMIARWLGLAVEEVLKRVLHLICEHQDKPRQVKISGAWIAIDPRRWSDEMAVKVHVGQAGVSRQSQVTNLALIAQKQEQIITTAGIANPLVTPKHYRNTLSRMVEAMGFKDPSRFFADVPEEQEQQEAPPDPKMVEAQAKIELEKAKLQATTQLETMKAQVDAERAQADLQQRMQLSQAELQHKAAMAERDAETQRNIAALKAQNEKEIAHIRIQAETELSVMRTRAETALARWKATQELALARERMDGADDDDGHAGSSNGSDKLGGGVKFGGKVG